MTMVSGHAVTESTWSSSLRTALGQSKPTNQYTVHIEIDNKVMESNSSDNLCLARKVNNEYSVVFLGKSIHPSGRQPQLEARDQFQWTIQYRVVCARAFKPPYPISAANKPMEIKLGYKATVEKGSMVIRPAQAALALDFPGNPNEDQSLSDSFILANVPSRVRAACECKVDDQKWQPIYIDSQEHVTVRDVVITPSNQYILFWDPYKDANTMFRYQSPVDGQLQPNKQEFTFEKGEYEKTFRFGYRTADAPTPDEEAEFYPL